MFPHSAAPRGRSAYGPYPPPPVTPPMTPLYRDYNHQRLPGVNNFYGPRPDRLPAYEWKPPPPRPPISTVPPPGTRNVITGRKRQYDEHSSPVVKRQRLDSLSRPVAGSTITPYPLPPRYDQPVAGSSRSGFDRSYPPSPHSRPPSQVPAVPESSSLLQSYAKDKLSGQMLELFEACQQQTSDLMRKETCRAQLQLDIQRVYAVARLYLTGSSMNGLGCRSSDADLCLVIKGNKRQDAIQVLSVLQRLFRSLSYVERTQLIRAKVPILRFREKGSDLEFDLNINNTVGIRNTFLLRSYADADVRIRPLILVVKKWARHSQINDASKGTLSSYTLVLMVLHYLQSPYSCTHKICFPPQRNLCPLIFMNPICIAVIVALSDPVVPSLQRDYPECFHSNMEIDMVPEGPKHIPPYISRNQSSLGELLLGFLKYYAINFRWDKQVISVREAKALPKNNSHEWRNKFICVEEPFERNNVARAVHEKIKFEAIKTQFSESWRQLQQRRDLNSLLPVRTIITKESSRR